MKKIGIFFLCLLLSIFLPVSVVSAAPESATTSADTPTFDASFDNNKGALYANGTPITISTDGTNTRISWEGGSVIVPSSVRVFGGGVADTNYVSSNITMVGGSVRNIFGGGLSIDETKPANVNDTQITIVNGTVTAGVYGGGLLYSEVSKATINVENGTIEAVVGGGAASTRIADVSYNSGTEEHPELSGTRVDSVSVTIEGGDFGSIFGGGQGYSYTKNTSINILGGSMYYVIAGGSNGYTESAQVDIRGGMIQVYQSVNRGVVKEVETVVTGGAISSFYVGGEPIADVTGTIDKADISILGGQIATLSAGISNSLPLDVTQSDYKVAFVTGSVINNVITQGADSFSYTIAFEKSIYRISQRTPFIPNLVITTNPTGFESLINEDLINFSTSDDNIAMVNSKGLVFGLKDGTVTISAKLFDHEATTSVKVNGLPINMVLEYIFMVILAIVLIVLLAIFIILKTLFNLIFRRSL